MFKRSNRLKYLVLTRSLILFALICDPTVTPAQQSVRVPLLVTVTNDSGRVVPGLKENNFTVIERKSKREIISFKETDEPVSIGLLFDTSASMRPASAVASSKRRLERLSEAVTSFLELSNSSNEYFAAS